MLRLSVFLLILSAAPLWAESQADKQSRCAAQSEIVAQAVEKRLDNKREKRALKQIMKSETVAGSKYEKTVDVLVNWVYTLPDAQLNDDVPAVFRDACIGYQP